MNFEYVVRLKDDNISTEMHQRKTKENGEELFDSTITYVADALRLAMPVADGYISFLERASKDLYGDTVLVVARGIMLGALFGYDLSPEDGEKLGKVADQLMKEAIRTNTIEAREIRSDITQVPHDDSE